MSGFNVGFQTSTESQNNIFRDNNVALVRQAISELSPPGANVFENNVASGL